MDPDIAEMYREFVVTEAKRRHKRIAENGVDPGVLTKKLRAAGISLCLDFVMNHTASSHRWAKAAQAGDPKYH